MEFDSIEWRFISVDPEVSIRHLAINSEGRIFAAGDQEFGYLVVDQSGATLYQSVLSASDFDTSTEIRRVNAINNSIYAIANSVIYAFDGSEIKTAEVNLSIIDADYFDDKLFVSDQERGLLSIDLATVFNISEDAISTINGGEFVRARVLKSLSQDQLLAVTDSRGVQVISRIPQGSYEISQWANQQNRFFNQNQISSISVLSRRAVAFATYGSGILILDDKGEKLSEINTSTGLLSDMIFDLHFTRNGRLWVGLLGGASTVNKSRLMSEPIDESAMVIEVDTEQLSEIEPTKSESRGLFSRVSSNIRNFFSALNPLERRLTELDEEEHDPERFTTIIRSVRETRLDSLVFRGAFAQEYFGVQALEQADTVNYIFPAEMNAYRFSYATNQFENVDQIQYQVKLEGLDQDWSNWSTNTYREYTNLNFGYYQFRVRSVNERGVVSAESSFRFQIRPPWHRTVWFYVFQLSLLMSFVMISFYLNKSGRAIGLAQFMIYLVIIITFEYVMLYTQPLFYSYTRGIAFFEIAISVVMVLCLTPVESGYRWVLNKATGVDEEQLKEAQKKSNSWLKKIASKGRFNRL